MSYVNTPPSYVLTSYVHQGQYMREMMASNNALMQRQMEENRGNYFTWLLEQQETARRESQRLRNHILARAYGAPQVAEPVDRYAESYVVETAQAEAAQAEFQQCPACLEGQANQEAHMKPGGCLCEECDEETLPPVMARLCEETDCEGLEPVIAHEI